MNGPGWTVVPGDPLVIHQRDRPRIYRYGHSRMQDIARRVSGVNGQPLIHGLSSRQATEQQDHKNTGSTHDFLRLETCNGNRSALERVVVIAAWQQRSF